MPKNINVIDTHTNKTPDPQTFMLDLSETFEGTLADSVA